ncbi:MAG: Gfo/Idh/MocA family oxidoreductase [Lentisphaeria bacterium]|nr:Gfo/Idh/MocA family oxidoreductase [Lentisphaeria bacterium]
MENCEKIKVGVVGTGALGRHHARLYAQNPRAEMVGIFDVQLENARKVGEEFGLPVFEKLEDLAASCDALSVAVPATYHASTVIPLLNMGKHILTEKPIHADIEGARAMCEAAEKNQVVFGVGHVERFNPAMDYLMEKKGGICCVEAHRMAAYPPSRPGLPPRGTEVSVILDLMIHDLDLVLALIDSEVSKIEAVGAALLSPGEDIVNARIEFVNGACALVSASRISTTPSRQVQVFKEDAFYSMDFGNHCGIIQHGGADGLVSEKVELPEKNALAAELDDFIGAVLKTKAAGVVQECRVSGKAGLKALEVAVAIEKLCRKNNQEHGFDFSSWKTGK